jgi:hypothetical protein
MAEAEGIPPTASVASVGQSLNYVKNFAYAYSGPRAVNNSTVGVLEFQTAGGILFMQTQFYCEEELGDDYQITMRLNDDEVFTFQVSTTGVNIGTNGQGPFYHIIPPFTKVSLEAKNVTDTSAHNWSATVIGRVYDA